MCDPDPAARDASVSPITADFCNFTILPRDLDKIFQVGRRFRPYDRVRRCISGPTARSFRSRQENIFEIAFARSRESRWRERKSLGRSGIQPCVP